MLREILLSRHFVWTWSVYTISFGIMLGLLYLVYRDDRKWHQEAFEEHATHVSRILASALSLMVDGGCAEGSIEELLNDTLSPTISGITLRLESGPVVASAGGGHADSKQGIRVYTERLSARTPLANVTGFELESEPYVLEIIADEFYTTLGIDSAKTLWHGVVLLLFYAWIRESIFARRRYLQEKNR